MTLCNILQKPTFINKVGDIYPIRIKDWDEFEKHLNILMLSKKHLEVNSEEDIPLLHRIVLGYQDDIVNQSLCEIFNLITRTSTFELEVTHENYYFINRNKQIVDSDNYEEIRNIVLRQNLLFEPKVYKTKLMQEWAERVLQARKKNAANITMEDMITTIAVISGKHYKDIAKYSIYQLQSEFQRINKIKQYETISILYANPYAASEVKLDHFAEYLDMYSDPYADLFKSKDKLTNIHKALG